MRERVITAVGGVLFLVGVVLLAALWMQKGSTEMNSEERTSIEDVPRDHWKNLASKRVFFGHQSVGFNVIEGIVDVMEEHPVVDLKIVESSNLESVEGAALIHHRVGANTDPGSKVKDFRKILATGSEGHVDIAILKFCYVDITGDSDAEAIFQQYREAISDLESGFPDTVFVHSTVPIETGPVGAVSVVKELVKPLLGRSRRSEKNLVRERYNRLLRSSDLGQQTVFDIARCEATGPEGSMAYQESGSEKAYFMDARYSSDGGHLNELGRRVVAEQFLVALARAANE